MVGYPKRLSDLNRIQANVRIICRRCRFEEDWTVAELSHHLAAIGGNQTWSEITRHLRCRRAGCGSDQLRHVVVPYAARQANLPRRIGALDARLVSAAVEVLEDATARSPQKSVATIEVHLALLVVYRYIRDQPAVRRFWEVAGNASRHTDESLHDPLAVIRHRLERGGWIAPRVLTERTPHWPWSSPPPPGWLAGPGRPRANDD